MTALSFWVGLGILALIGLAALRARIRIRQKKARFEIGPVTPAQDGSPEQLLRSGRKIEAIKRYREQKGVGLREAKDAVDAMEQRTVSLPAKSAALLRQVNDSEIEAQIRSGHLVDAVKLYRAKTGAGLKEAKDAVDAWHHKMRAS